MHPLRTKKHRWRIMVPFPCLCFFPSAGTDAPRLMILHGITNSLLPIHHGSAAALLSTSEARTAAPEALPEQSVLQSDSGISLDPT